MALMPNSDEVAHALSALLRREVLVRIVHKAPADRLMFGGLYHGGGTDTVATVAADIDFAARAGACFSLIPPDAADECVERGALDESSRENFAEVLNVMSRLFAPKSGGRVALQTVICPPDRLPAAALAAPAAGRGGHFEIDIDGYGAGFISLRALA